MGMSLFEIDSNIRSFIDALYSSVDEDGCIVEGDFEKLEELQMARETKIDNIALYYKECIVQAKALKDEAALLTSRAKSAEKKAERLKKYLSDSMIASGNLNHESSKCKISFRTSNPLVIDDETALAKKWFVKKVEYVPDKTAIKDAINSGKAVKGAHIEEKKNIQIK